MERNYISKYADADTKAFVLTKRAEKVTNFCENVRSYRSEHEMYPYKNWFKKPSYRYGGQIPTFS